MEYGEFASDLRARAAEADTPEEVPRAIRECPVLTESQADMYSAFKTLSAVRTMGFATANPIAFAEMAAFIAMRPFCEPWYFFRVIRSLDDVWLADAHERAKQTAKN